jgi:hypothetical protein
VKRGRAAVFNPAGYHHNAIGACSSNRLREQACDLVLALVPLCAAISAQHSPGSGRLEGQARQGRTIVACHSATLR